MLELLRHFLLSVVVWLGGLQQFRDVIPCDGGPWFYWNQHQLQLSIWFISCRLSKVTLLILSYNLLYIFINSFLIVVSSNLFKYSSDPRISHHEVLMDFLNELFLQLQQYLYIIIRLAVYFSYSWEVIIQYYRQIDYIIIIL